MEANKEQVLAQIVESAEHNNDVSKFGKEVAQILKSNNLIDEAVLEIILGK